MNLIERGRTVRRTSGSPSLARRMTMVAAGRGSSAGARRVVTGTGRRYVLPLEGNPFTEPKEATLAVKFLSAEWTAAVTDALNSSPEFSKAAGGQRAQIQQVVTGTPDGETKYYFKLDGGKAEISLGELADPETTISQTYETATAINKRELNAQNAFMQGKLKISGNMMKLVQIQGVISTIPEAVAGIDVEY
jgi:putative sterol carrier protein